jgi:hypothetical protein
MLVVIFPGFNSNYFFKNEKLEIFGHKEVPERKPLFSCNMCQEFSESTYHGLNLSKVPKNLLEEYGLRLHSIFSYISLPAM